MTWRARLNKHIKRKSMGWRESSKMEKHKDFFEGDDGADLIVDSPRGLTDQVSHGAADDGRSSSARIVLVLTLLSSVQIQFARLVTSAGHISPQAVDGLSLCPLVVPSS
jgi:hypothetical protein